jgi:hypothetical protein
MDMTLTQTRLLNARMALDDLDSFDQIPSSTAIDFEEFADDLEKLLPKLAAVGHEIEAGMAGAARRESTKPRSPSRSVTP